MYHMNRQLCTELLMETKFQLYTLHDIERAFSKVHQIYYSDPQVLLVMSLYKPCIHIVV
jgi:hypothetical protein